MNCGIVIQWKDYGLKWKNVLKEIFPNQQLIKVDWITGLFVLPTGKIVKGVQRYGDKPTYENYILLEIDKGILKKEKQFNHKEFDEFKETDEYEKLDW